MGSFLVEHLDYNWNEVHDDAEVLEHVTSEQLADHLESYLNHPKHCPHGGIIPKRNRLSMKSVVKHWNPTQSVPKFGLLVSLMKRNY